MAKVGNTLQCPHCGGFLIEPIFDLDYVALLIGIHRHTLVHFLGSGPGKTWEKRYRFFRGSRRKRVLFASEVQELQKHFIRKTRRREPLVVEEKG